VEAKTDTSLFVYHQGGDTVYLLLYVDDIVLTASSPQLLRHVIDALQLEFSMKDLGELHHFLGMHVQRSGSGLLLSQRQYMMEILQRASMSDCKPCATPVDTNPKLPADGGVPVADPTDFRSLAGALQYLTFTHPDIAYDVQQVCLHMHDPREPHLAALKRILRYVRGTLHMGLLLRPSAQTLIELAALTLASRLPVMLSSPGPPNAKLQFCVPVLRPNTELSPMLLQRFLGCANFWLSCMHLLAGLPWFTATTSAPSTCPPIPSSINAPNMLRLIFILFGSVLLKELSASFMFQQAHSTPTSSPRACRLLFSQSSGPV